MTGDQVGLSAAGGSEGLRPCPFCGKDAAIEAWNRRAGDAS